MDRTPHAGFDNDIAASIGESGSIASGPEPPRSSSTLGEQVKYASLGQDFRGSLINIVREQARQYMASFPGNDASGCNSDHAWFRRLADGELVEEEDAEYLSDVLCYRTSMMRSATDIKNRLDLPIEDGHLCDTWV